MDLLEGEQRPNVIEAEPPDLVVWSSLWPAQPGALVRFDLFPERSGGTDLRWTLMLEANADPGRLGHYRRRINQLINANLRYTFGQ